MSDSPKKFFKRWFRFMMQNIRKKLNEGVVITSDNQIYIAGSTQYDFPGTSVLNKVYEDVFLAKLDQDGVQLMAKQWGPAHQNYVSDLITGKDDGELYITGNNWNGTPDFTEEEQIFYGVPASGGRIDSFLIKWHE